ncbi:MAG: YciI family protein [Chitinophagales bacterium]
MKHFIFVFTFVFLCSATFSQSSPQGMEEMKTYYLVFLKRGTNRTQDSVTSEKIQEGHMAHLNKMAAEGKMDLAGPLMDDGDLRGICVYNAGSLEEAKKLAEDDPAVKAGRLIVEIHPWYSMKGACLK